MKPRHMPIEGIKKGDDGLRKDCVMVARMDGDEVVAISLHTLTAPLEGRR